MLRRTALTALLLLSADAATTALSPLGAPSLTAEASAADFTGRIKRVRIKRRRSGSGYRLITQTGGDTSGSVAKVETKVRHPSEFLQKDEPLEVVVLDIDVVNRLVGTSTDTGDIAPNATVTVMLSNIEDDDFGWDEEDGYTPEERTKLEILMADGQGEGVGEGGQKVRVRVTNDGALRVIVSNEDRDWDPDTVASIATTLDGETINRVEVEEVRQKWIADLETDLSEYDAVTVETILYDADGAVLDTQTQTVSLTDDGQEPGVNDIKLKETNKGAAKLVTWTTSDGDAASLEVELTDSETGEAVIYTVDDAPVLTERTYLYEGIEFDPGESPEQHYYLCLIDLIDASGDPVGEQYEVELIIPTLEEGEDYAVYTDSFADGTGSVGFLNTGDGYHVVGALWHEDAGQAVSFNLIFEEPFEGPPPLETGVNATIVSQQDKWIQKGGALPSSYDLTATLTTAEGAVLESITASGSGTGSVYTEKLKEGEIVAGTVVTVGDKEVILNIGFKSEG
ncbi:MAG: hypothetical protein ACI8RZ_000514 [Myxococcota bacterium]|jgi:hypothetical protein